MTAVAQYTIIHINDVIASDVPPENPYEALWFFRGAETGRSRGIGETAEYEHPGSPGCV